MHGGAGGPGGPFGPGPVPGVQAFPVLAQGTRLLEQFSVEKVLGQGGYSRVYLARDPMQQEMALKVVHSFGLGEQLYRNLYEEYQSQARIREIQHVVRADRPLQCRHENMDLVLLPMERAQWSMRGWLDETSSRAGDEARLAKGLEFLTQACRGLAAIHRAGLVHLDIKPENLLLFQDGSTRQGEAQWLVKVADFGLSRGLERSGSQTEMQEGAGTPAYMAPEQIRAAHWRDVQSPADVYALGMILFELLDGDLPYSGSAAKIREKKLDRDMTIRTPQGPPHLVRLALRCLERDPGKRPTAEELAPLLILLDPEEEQAFAQAKNTNTEQGWQTFLSAYPQGRRAQEAQSSLNDLREARLAREREEAERKRREAGVPGQPWTEPYTGMEFIWVPGGTFEMGHSWVPYLTSIDEQPEHTVELDGFWLGKYPVTQAQWERIMGSNPSHFKGPNNPVEKVSWNDAQDFIRALHARSSAIGFRLPTEAEWEYSARAGTETYRYWGNDIDCSRANFGSSPSHGECNGRNPDQTSVVGSYPPNPWGLYDMLGNVLEWCQDWYDENYYTQSPRCNPTGPDSGTLRVSRGGSWLQKSNRVRSAFRSRNSPDNRSNSIGFRLVRAVSN